MSVDEFKSVISSGDLRAQLIALRDYLAAALDQCRSSRDQAPLAAQLRQVLIDLDAMPLSGEESTVDEIARQRAARRSLPA